MVLPFFSHAPSTWLEPDLSLSALCLGQFARWWSLLSQYQQPPSLNLGSGRGFRVVVLAGEAPRRAEPGEFDLVLTFDLVSLAPFAGRVKGAIISVAAVGGGCADLASV